MQPKNFLHTLAHLLWKEVLETGDIAIDATCGNGHDTLALIEMGASVIALDVQPAALDATRARVRQRAQLLLQSHETLPCRAKLVVYNLGYLPGSDKQLTTRVETTLKSLQDAMKKAQYISVMAYPGHAEGLRELEAIVAFCATQKEWLVSMHTLVNRVQAPQLLFLQKNIESGPWSH